MKHEPQGNKRVTMFKNKLLTKFGNFHYATNEKVDKNNPTVIFFTGMGINSSYYDYYNLVNYFPENINYILVDLLGAGESSVPQAKLRNLYNISEEISALINYLSLKKIYICCHSFSAIYILNCIRSGLLSTQILGFIGIDPTSADIMMRYENIFDNNLEEALENARRNKAYEIVENPDTDVNPLLPDHLYQNCLQLYCSLSGSESEISELRQAMDSVKKMQSIKLPDNIPSLSFISTLNINDYLNFGNPYFNMSKNSVEVKLNGHHFLHWIHPQIMSSIIVSFVHSTLMSNEQ
ncbi:alpha/beta fold hydrolase [Leuconostoc carnosum]|uniref:alpha/beta fold hydrolase n=2 Tax=Lactobacillaceae TaxID=33958 RepID=UPI001CC23B33|nr:alpha/beta hydrolase [Leuconostoc carnosum]